MEGTHDVHPEDASNETHRTTTSRTRQHMVGWFVADVLVNLVVLNLAAELVHSIVVDRFSISIFVAVVLTLILDAIEWLEHKIQHFFCVKLNR